MMRQQISRKHLQHLMCALFLSSFCGLATVKAQTTQPIVPFLDELTVNPTTGVATAYFGYHNPNSTTKTIAVGLPANFFTPLPEDRGQPDRFLPGVHHYRFAAIFNYQFEPTITWILNGSSATADSATALAQPQNSIFTYQGRLTDGATAASGTYQMQFALYDAATGGTQVGSTLTNTNVNVSAGLFTVQLNFGSSPFTGADRYLEIAVKHPGDPSYTTLTPRQQLTASPFAIHTIRASSADALSNACVGCVTSNQIDSVDASKINGNVAGAEHAITAITAGNVTGVVGIGNGGTGSSVKNFVDLSTNQSNIGGDKSFTGILSGNGSGLNNVPGTVRWQVVAGTSQQAQSNTGYLLTNAGQVTVTLPNAPNVGDIVRVSGVGLGGWKLAQNSGQAILGVQLNLFNDWSVHESNRNWTSVASSSDGRKLVAVTQPGLIYTSTDSGESWTARATSLGNRSWVGVASSADGTKLVAVVHDGQIYTSTNSGITWTARASNRAWSPVASSADGTKLVAAVANGGAIYTSADSGVTWTERDTGHQWTGLACSADGSKLFAVNLDGVINFSNDSGLTWNHTTFDALASVQFIASSADGTKLVALGSGSRIFTSTDSGVSWTPRESARNWNAIASSADGIHLVAAVSGGQIYSSADSGLSWSPRESNRIWQSIASSTDGGKLVAVVHGGQIHTSNSNTSSGAAGYLIGGQYTAIELQYLGNGQFFPLSYLGTILAH